MRRLLLILDSLNVGGAETFLMKISRCLSAEEYQFDFIVSQNDGAYIEEVIARGGKVFVVPPRRKALWEALVRIKTIVNENRYDVVLRLGDSPLVGIDLIAARLGGANRLCFRSCNALTGLSKKEKIMDTLLRPLLNCITDIKIAPSVLAAEYTFGKHHVHEINLLNNGVDLNVFHYDLIGREKIRHEFGLTNRFVIGHIGRFQKQKNHRFLLETFIAIRERCLETYLLLVGTGDLEPEIRALISFHKLEPYVIFAGIRSDVPQLLSAMDVFVFPSLHEGMPNTVIEAQATGLPCIIADTITREADITGLVQYVSLEKTPEEWANIVLGVDRSDRKDTTQSFIDHGYDIQSSAKRFVELVFGKE